MKTKTLVIACVATFLSAPAFALARPPKVTEPLFQGQSDDVFAGWIAEKIRFEELLDVPEMGQEEPFIVSFKVDEYGKVADISGPQRSDYLFVGSITEALEGSPDWTPAYKRKKAQATVYHIVVRPSERRIQLFGEGEGESVEPGFQGGDLKKFRDWVMFQIQYPTLANVTGISGKVEIKFTVDELGYPHIEEVVLSPHRYLAAEVARIILSSRWTPGTFEGIPVKFYYVLPIDFIIK